MIGDEKVDEMKRILEEIHQEIGVAEFKEHPHFVLDLPHTLGTIKDKPLFESVDVLLSPKELISEIRKLCGGFAIPKDVDLDKLVERMHQTDEKVYLPLAFLQ